MGLFLFAYFLKLLDIADCLKLFHRVDDLGVIHARFAFKGNNESSALSAYHVIVLDLKRRRRNAFFVGVAYKIAYRVFGTKLDVDLDHARAAAHSVIEIVQKSKYDEDHKSADERQLVKSESDGKTHAGGRPESCGGGESLYLIAVGNDNRARAEKTYSAYDLRSHANDIARAVRLICVLIRHHDNGRSKGNQHICSHACGSVFYASLKADNTAENDSHNDSKDYRKQAQRTGRGDSFKQKIHLFILSKYHSYDIIHHIADICNSWGKNSLFIAPKNQNMVVI
jgi:hypothetical protein